MAKPLTSNRPSTVSTDANYRWISWLGELLYAELVLAVGLFFALSASMAIGERGNLLATRVFIPLFVAIPATAALYLLAVILFLFRTTVGDRHIRRAIQITVIVALLAMLYCVWWVSRAFL